MMPFPKIAVIGAGALGIYYGVRLGRGGAHVRFLLRRDLAAVRARDSLLVHEKDETLELRPVSSFATTAEVGAVDLVFVTLKSTANHQLEALLPPLIGPETAVFTLQNGLGTDETIAALIGPGRVLGGLAFIASTRTGPGEVTCYHPGSITLGEYGRPATARARALAAQLSAAGVTTRVVDDLLSARWHKLVWNIPFNGLAIAAGGIATDCICADPVLAGRVRTLMKEVQLAASCLGFSISDEFLRGQFEVTPPMGPYRPSSLIDYLAGQEVEIEAIWGEPLRRAQAAGANVPEMERLYAELLARTKTARGLV